MLLPSAQAPRGSEPAIHSVFAPLDALRALRAIRDRAVAAIAERDRHAAAAQPAGQLQDAVCVDAEVDLQSLMLRDLLMLLRDL